jgi:hypothetical protein
MKDNKQEEQCCGCSPNKTTERRRDLRRDSTKKWGFCWDRMKREDGTVPVCTMVRTSATYGMYVRCGSGYGPYV